MHNASFDKTQPQKYSPSKFSSSYMMVAIQLKMLVILYNCSSKPHTLALKIQNVKFFY